MTPKLGDAARAFIFDTAETRRGLAIERLHVATGGMLGVSAVESMERWAAARRGQQPGLHVEADAGFFALTPSPAK